MKSDSKKTNVFLLVVLLVLQIVRIILDIKALKEKE